MSDKSLDILLTNNGTGAGALLNCTAGQTSIAAASELHLRFDLLITPLKPLDPLHWRRRFFPVPLGSRQQYFPSPHGPRYQWSDAECWATGANIVTQCEPSSFLRQPDCIVLHNDSVPQSKARTRTRTSTTHSTNGH